jgi:hypothetical protein
MVACPEGAHTACPPQVCGLRIDRATAHVLQHSDEHANEKGEVQLGLQQVRVWSLQLGWHTGVAPCIACMLPTFSPSWHAVYVTTESS